MRYAKNNYDLRKTRFGAMLLKQWNDVFAFSIAFVVLYNDLVLFGLSYSKLDIVNHLSNQIIVLPILLFS